MTTTLNLIIGGMFLVIIAQWALLFYILRASAIERHTLCDRIQAGTLIDYTEHARIEHRDEPDNGDHDELEEDQPDEGLMPHDEYNALLEATDAGSMEFLGRTL